MSRHLPKTTSRGSRSQRADSDFHLRFSSGGFKDSMEFSKHGMKRFIVEQTMSSSIVFGLYLSFFVVQVSPVIMKELISSYSSLSLELKAGIVYLKANYIFWMAVLAAVLLFKLIFDRLFLMGFLKISLRTELFKLSIYLSLAFTYIVYPLMIILLGVSIADWTKNVQDGGASTSELVGLLVPVVWAFVIALASLNVWGEFTSRNNCPSRSMLGTVRPRSEMLAYTAWHVSLLLSTFVLFSDNSRTRIGSSIELVMSLFILAGSLSMVHMVVFWNQRLAVFYLSWAATAFGLKVISSLVDFYLILGDTNPKQNDPYILLALLLSSVLKRVGAGLAYRLYCINVWDQTVNLTTRFAGFLLMVDAVTCPDLQNSEKGIYYRGLLETCPLLHDSEAGKGSNQISLKGVEAKRTMMSLFQPVDDKNTKQIDHAQSQPPMKEQKTEASSWYIRGISKSRSKTIGKQDFQKAKSNERDPNCNMKHLQTQHEPGHEDLPSSAKESSRSNMICQILIEYAKTFLDQSDERVWQLLLLLHMHRGFPSLVVLSRLLQRLESRALKRGISAQLEYYNFRKLYGTKLDVLYKGTATEGEQPTMHSVWDIYCTMSLEDSVGEWDGGSGQKRSKSDLAAEEQIELAKVPKIHKLAVLGEDSTLAEPNWPFDQLKYYNMVVAKVLKLTDTRKALFSNLQGDKTVQSSFIYSCNENSIKYHSQVKKDFQIFAANPPQFASYVYPMFIYYFSLIRNSPRLSKSILSAYKSKLLSIASQIKRKPKFEDVDWIQATCVSLQISMDVKDLGAVVSASLNYSEHFGDDPDEVPLVGKNINSLLPLELASKHKAAMQKCQELESLEIHKKPFFLLGLDSQLKSTQAVVKILPCLSKRITAVSLLNFQYNPGSALVLVEKDMNILHAEKRFWDALQDHPVDSLEELSIELHAAMKLYSFVLSKQRQLGQDETADHSGVLLKTERFFRGYGSLLQVSDQGQLLSNICLQLYTALQEFWKLNEAKGLAFGIPADSPYWGAFEDDQIVGGFDWNPASSICSDVYKVYLRLARVQNTGHQRKRSPARDPQQPVSLMEAAGSRLAAPTPTHDGLFKFNSQRSTTSNFSKIADKQKPQVPFRTGENAFKEAVPMSGDAGAQMHRSPMPPTPFPHRPVRSDSHDSFEDSVMHPPPETTGRMVLAASLADQPLP